ncbi:MAG: hypothetical protein KDE19_13805 [Caldilineaceae bacterium]|nr:hypothetical protein [Caldilineaceae bacterium]
MALPFTRSMRSLESDSDYFSAVGSIVVILLLVAWGIWFFGARITLVETGQIIQTATDGTVWAEFPAAISSQIYRAQPAMIRFQTADTEEATAIPATVLSTEPAGDLVNVLLYAEPDRTTIPLFEEGLSGQVDLETGQLSPAMLFGQVSGQFVDTPPVTLNPQQ